MSKREDRMNASGKDNIHRVNGFFDQMRTKFKLGNDKALADFLGIRPYTISRVRSGAQDLSKETRYDISVATGMTIAKIDEIVDGGKRTADKSGKLFDYLRKEYELTSDSALCERIGLWPYVVSRIRTGKQELSKENKYDISVATGLSIKKIDEMIAEGVAKHE